MKMFRIIIVCLLIAAKVFAQESHAMEHNQPIQHHKLVLFTGYGLISGATDTEGQSTNKVIPVLGLDYEYWFNHNFGIIRVGTDLSKSFEQGWGAGVLVTCDFKEVNSTLGFGVK